MTLVEIDTLPEGLTEAKTNVLMKGSHGNDHTFVNGLFYPKQVDRFIFGYFVAGKNCQLHHVEHGKGEGELKTAKLPEGSIHELRKQFEDTNAGMVEVLD